jgi:hypothetical protein
MNCWEKGKLLARVAAPYTLKGVKQIKAVYCLPPIQHAKKTLRTYIWPHSVRSHQGEREKNECLYDCVEGAEVIKM